MKALILFAVILVSGCSSLPSLRSNDDRCFDLCQKTATEDSLICLLSKYTKGMYQCDCKCEE